MEVVLKFGDDLEYDLHRFLGVDLLDFFRGVHPWGKLSRLTVRLPWYSNYKRALEDDEEFWREYYAQVDDPQELSQTADRPSMAGWDEWRDMAAEIKDHISMQTISLLSPHVPKGKPKPKFKPVKRPLPARARIHKERQDALDDALEASLIGMLTPDDPRATSPDDDEDDEDRGGR